MGATGRLYLRSLLPVWLTMPLYSFYTVRGPCGEARALPATAVACRPYPCQVGRTTTGSSMPVLGRLHRGGSATLEI
ncbi:hypothetical protein BHM03_00058755 [Ensete ventricosum]|nr:hypothetical protein BHM03_00058755 [Ensete ventricosum]